MLWEYTLRSIYIIIVFRSHHRNDTYQTALQNFSTLYTKTEKKGRCDMRIVWKDSANARQRKPVKYRNYFIEGCGKGWVTNMPGDDNIYKNHYCALNAIDQALGGYGKKGKPNQKRLAYGIEIIGKKDASA